MDDVESGFFCETYYTYIICHIGCEGSIQQWHTQS